MRRSFSLLAKPTGAACNLECSYCFFLSKEVLWDAQNQQMDAATLDAWLRAYLASQPDGPVTIAWQGGEPTLRGLDFFTEAVRLARAHARPGQRVEHTLQTNATLIDDAWAEFLAAERFLVGVSVDGPAPLHDAHRVNRAGRGTHDQVVRGWRTLQRHAVETNVLCAVNRVNADHPLEVYRHFRDELDARFVQFIPIVERVDAGEQLWAEQGWRDAEGRRVLYRQSGAGTTSRSVTAEQWGSFLCAVFDEWLARDVGEVFVQHFDVTLGARLGQWTLCVHAPECGGALAVEHSGDVYSCDHYVEPGHRLGNLTVDDLGAMASSAQQRDFGRAKRLTLPTQCRECPVRWACHGGCPKDRFDTTADGEPGLNHLCAGYFRFFSHATPAIVRMAQLVSTGRPAAHIMGDPRR